jgi:hypothetical protein
MSAVSRPESAANGISSVWVVTCYSMDRLVDVLRLSEHQRADLASMNSCGRAAIAGTLRALRPELTAWPRARTLRFWTWLEAFRTSEIRYSQTSQPMCRVP